MPIGGRCRMNLLGYLVLVPAVAGNRLVLDPQAKQTMTLSATAPAFRARARLRGQSSGSEKTQTNFLDAKLGVQARSVQQREGSPKQSISAERILFLA